MLFVVRSLLKASPQLHAHTMVDLLQTTPYSLPSDYTSDHFLWSQISAKIPSYHTFTQQQNHCRPPCCILCCQTTDQTLFSGVRSLLKSHPITHLPNNKTTADHHTVFFVVRLQIRLYSLVSDLCQKPIPSHTYATTKSLQTTALYSSLSDYRSDFALWHQISAKSPAHPTRTDSVQTMLCSVLSNLGENPHSTTQAHQEIPCMMER